MDLADADFVVPILIFQTITRFAGIAERTWHTAPVPTPWITAIQAEPKSPPSLPTF